MVSLSCLLWTGLAFASAQVKHVADAQAFSNVQDARSIFVELHASTWKTRGRFFWDVEGSLRTKLNDVGFTVVRHDTDPHTLTLTVDYQEIKGEPIGINRFGTVIDGKFFLSHQAEGQLLEISIHESASPSASGTPPYLDVLHNFLTNPYYHYLGEILWGEIQGSQDIHGILLDLLQAEASRKDREEELDFIMSRAQHSQHTMPSGKNVYAPLAIRRTIDEFVKVNDTRLIGILKDLLQYPDVYVQVRSIEAFGDFGVTDALPFLTDLSRQSQQVEVRAAAHRTIKLLTTSSR